MTTVERKTPPPKRMRFGWRRLIGPAFSLILIAAVFVWFLPQFTSLSDVWTAVRSMTTVEVGILVLAAIWNLATYQFVMVTATPGLRLRQATVSTESTTAVANTLIGGAAVAVGLTYTMNSSWGFSRSRTSVSLLVSGLWNNFAKLGMPILAVVLLVFTGTPTAGRLVVGLVGLGALILAVVLLWMSLRSREGAAKVGRGLERAVSAVLRLLHRPPAHGWDDAMMKFRDRTVLLLRARWHWLTLTTLVSHFSLFLVLLLSLRFVGVSTAEVGVLDALAVFAFARLATAIPFTPGGVGVVELAMIAGLAAAGGVRADVAAGVLVYRVLTYVLPIPVGLGTYLFWRRNKSWRRAPNSAPRTPLVPETA